MEQGQHIGHYVLGHPIGSGGMGMLFLAEDTRLQRKVALKFLSDARAQDADFKKRFITEGRAAARLNHPNICTVYEIAEEDDQLYIALEYLEGQTLQAILDEGPLAPERAIRIALQIARGLNEAHRNGIVHRDIKPANLMIAEDDEVKIMDFGLAKVAGGESITREGTTIGTVAYMAPEQAQGLPVDERTDIWALGVVLYEMLAGVQPFDGDYPQAVLYAVTNLDPPPLAEQAPETPEPLIKTIDRCLEKLPAYRLASAKAFIRALDDDDPTTSFIAQPAPTKRLVLRRSLIGASAVVLFGLMSLWLMPGRLGEIIPGGFASKNRHIAVLPFEHIGPSTKFAPIGRGLVHTLSSELTRMEWHSSSLWVVPASEIRNRNIVSVSDARDAFNVNYVLTGSIQEMGELVRLTVNLVDAASLRQVRSDVLDLDASDLSGLQMEAVLLAAGLLDVQPDEAVQARLLTEAPRLPGAYDFYLQGLGFLSHYDDPRNVETAIDLFEQAIDEDPTYALAHARLGEAAWRMYQHNNDTTWYHTAIRHTDEALELDRELAPAWLVLGLIHRGEGKYEEAIQDYSQALAIDPNNGNVHRSLAGVYYNLRDTSLAEQHYRLAVQMRPDYWAGYNSLGIFYHRQKRHREAAEQFKAVTRLAPSNHFGWNNLGAQYLAFDEPDSAAIFYLRSIEARPSALAYRNVGNIAYRNEEYDRSAEMYEKAVELEPESITSWGHLANAYYYGSSPREKANEAWEKVVELGENRLLVNPNSPIIVGALATTHALLGEPEQALDYVDRLTNIEPMEPAQLRNGVLALDLLDRRDEALQYLEAALDAGLTFEDVESSQWAQDLTKDARYLDLKQERTNQSTPKSEL